MRRFIILFFAQIYICQSLNIFQVIPGFSQSHVLFNHRLAQMLTKAGHNVTLLNMVMMPNLKTKPPPDNIKEFTVMPDFPPELLEGIMSSFQDFIFKPLSASQMWNVTVNFLDVVALQCRDILNREELMEKLIDSKFDVTLSHFFAFCPNALSRMMKVPKFIWVAPGTFFLDHVAEILGLPNIASYNPMYMADSSDKMSFTSRMKNFLLMFMTYEINLSSLSVHKTETKIIREFPNENFPDLWSVAKDTQALLINGEEFLDFPRPTYHAMLHMGNLEKSQEAKKLPQDWQDLMDNSNKGVILFSLGTIANTSLMPTEIKEAFVEAFSRFDDYLIIWRLEGEIPKGLEQQKHIKIVTWMPQRDLLVHPKMKVFITHGGYNSLLETAKAGIPMILMPLFSDQYANAHRAVRHGLGLMLDKLKIDGKIIFETIDKILSDNSYHENAQKLSSFFEDKLIPNEEKTVKLIEKIARSKNWPTLKAAQRLNLIQYYCLDVISILSIFLFMCVYFVVKVLIIIFHVVEKFQ